MTGARSPFALHLTRLLHAAGHTVLLTDSVRNALAAFSGMHDGYERTPSPRFETAAFQQRLLDLIDSFRPDLILPTTEEIFYVADGLERAGRSDLLFAPPFERLAEVHDKARFAALAGSLGAGATHNVLLENKTDVADFDGDPRDFVFKPVWSRFASRVLIGPERNALDAIAPSPADPWLAQSRVVGDELCVYAVAHRGTLVALSIYRNLLRAGAGTGLCHEQVEAPAVADFVRRFVTATGWHGQVSFDIIQPADGPFVCIECNPRATSGVSFFMPPDGLAEAILEGKPARAPSRHLVAIKTTALFVGFLSWLRVVRHRPWVRNVLPADDVFHFPGDGRRFIGQIRSAAEVFEVARREKISPLEATTWDMEWNGARIGDVAPPDAPSEGRAGVLSGNGHGD